MCEHQVIDKPKLVSLEGMHRRDIVRGLWAGTMVLGVPGAAGCESAAEFFAPSAMLTSSRSPRRPGPRPRRKPRSRAMHAPTSACRRSAGRSPPSPTCPNAQWEFVVFDSKEKNAFCLPGGKVGFYKGLMDFCDNDDQIAAVLGHEVGHVVAAPCGAARGTGDGNQSRPPGRRRHCSARR